MHISYLKLPAVRVRMEDSVKPGLSDLGIHCLPMSFFYENKCLKFWNIYLEIKFGIGMH